MRKYFDESLLYGSLGNSNGDYSWSFIFKCIILLLAVWYIIRLILLMTRLNDRIISTDIQWIETPSINYDLFTDVLLSTMRAFDVGRINFSTISLPESSFAQNYRSYSVIRFRNYEHIFSIVPYGTGYAISYRLLRPHNTFAMFILSIPYIGKWIIAMFFTETFYSSDTLASFNAMMQQAYRAAVEAVTSSENVRILPGKYSFEEVYELFKSRGRNY